MSTVATLESVCADAWPPQVTQELGQWRLRAASGYTGRANSALLHGDPGVPTATALGRVVSFAEEHGIRPYAQVVVGSRWERDLAAQGWSVNLAHPKGAESAVLHSPLGTGPTTAQVDTEPPPGWLELAVGGAVSEAQRHVLTGGPKVGFASVRKGAQIVGVARGCVVDDWLHIAVVEVRHDYRRQGIATELLNGLDRWAAGARGRVLQVATDNEAALALYQRQGYRESHRYRYWVPAS
ncbi:ribosomal protein S18 acetylase RimI-like enzyme [Actinokineospora baliensis]|uniref:GNAT family N-acetyltransferase n=1 Tax=Actinokineospora baliensis TaxID=547056 RepID=UPI0019581B69|nr:GNAT family N-acetyltransferase [Actinokineospora baliensis]MBM7772027.1 ribosomal protein S18 acetylase RimI-like enzyme [Actinokineospora baliensis]